MRSGRQGLSSPGLKFNDVEIGRLQLEVIPDGTPCPSPTYYFRDPACSPPPSSPIGVLKFDGTRRFVDDTPVYTKTTGLLLAHDFDRKEAWRGRGNVEVGKQIEPRPKTDAGFQYGVDFINPDVGNKITFKTEVENHHVRHAASFK